MQRIEAANPRFLEKETRLRGLLVQGLGGDAVAYHRFLQDLGSHLRAYFRQRLTQRPDDVEDLVQETLLAVHNHRQTYRSDQPLTAWVHGIARYKFIDSLREHASRGALTDPLNEELDLFAATDTEAGDAKRDVAALLAALPDRQRLPIVHVKLEGLSVVEAAHKTGLSESAVKIGIHRGLKVLAAKLRENK